MCLVEMIGRFARDESLERPPDLNDAQRARTLSRLALAHPISCQEASAYVACAQCSWKFCPAESIGQRQCRAHPRPLDRRGYYPCCGGCPPYAKGCVPADHCAEPISEWSAWDVPDWLSIRTPLRHTVIVRRAGWISTSLRLDDDMQDDETEKKYSLWHESNNRLIAMCDAHLIIFIEPAYGVPPSPTETTLEEILEKKGPIIRHLH